MNAPEPLSIAQAALACLELSTVARGMVVLDAMVKRAEVGIVAARTLSPGRYLIVISAPEADIEEAMQAALAVAADDLVDSVTLHDPHKSLKRALGAGAAIALSESLLMVETTTLSSLFLGLDRALKEADIDLMELRLGAGLSGKGVALLTGSLDMTQAARAVVQRVLQPVHCLRLELIASPHPDLPKYLLDAEPALPRGRG